MVDTVEDVSVPDLAEPGEAAEPLPGSTGRAPREPRRRDKTSKQTWRRRSMPIRAYVGVNGSFKTATAVRDLLPSIDAGRIILSTVPIFDTRTGDLYEHYVKFDSWSYLLDEDFRHADILMDEVTGIANARDAMGMPRQVQAVLDKLRKRDLTLSWTAPAWGRADATIRSCTVGVSLCVGMFTAPDPAKKTSGEIAAWRPKRLARVRTFDARNFEEFSLDRATGGVQKHRRLKAEVVEWWWGPGSRVFESYNSFDPVSRVGEVLDSGRCAHCGGSRPIPRCTCPN